jgi:trehalose-phosphatase
MLHTRGLDAEEARRFEDEASGTWASLEPGTLDLRKVSGGVELRSRGADKGTAVLRLLAETPRGAVVVYLGDDETDEDAFAALAGRGVGIRVGPLQATRASVTLPDTQAVLKFLESWRSVTSR